MRKNLFLTAALFWTGVILFLCLDNANNLPVINILYIDKVIHVVLHFVFTTLWFLYLKKKLDNASNFKPLALAFVFSFIFGILIELMQQYFTTTRIADIFDVLSNLLGASFAVTTIILLNAYNRIIDKI
ncbi:VanZ family protein [Flavobacterium sp.]|uniref:VanZ family protein n=1 Tax=Flavobacterium sp. TaxID=239 RepID=UPI00286DD5BF|nr:VanZ family protein [Flavobacterium sp.]